MFLTTANSISPKSIPNRDAVRPRWRLGGMLGERLRAPREGDQLGNQAQAVHYYRAPREQNGAVVGQNSTEFLESSHILVTNRQSLHPLFFGSGDFRASSFTPPSNEKPPPLQNCPLQQLSWLRGTFLSIALFEGYLLLPNLAAPPSASTYCSLALFPTSLNTSQALFARSCSSAVCASHDEQPR